MQEEISKHTKKAYKTMINSKFTLSEKIKEIAIEIFIIVFAITLSISLHSWSEKHHQKEEAKEFLLDIKKDLAIDNRNLEDSSNNISIGIEYYNFLLQLTKRDLDSLQGKVSINYRTQRFNSSIGNYEGFKSSGKLGYIENKKLKTKILNYYQQTITEINASEKLFQNKQDYIIDNIIINYNMDTEKRYLNTGTKYRLEMLIAVSNGLCKQYKDASIQINEITEEINSEFKE